MGLNDLRGADNTLRALEHMLWGVGECELGKDYCLVEATEKAIVAYRARTAGMAKECSGSGQEDAKQKSI
jgi:hypothetical protein